MIDKRKDIAREIGRRYCTLTPAGVETLASILVPFKVNKGEHLMNEGDVCSFMYYVERGMVRQFYYKNGRDVTEHFSYEGRIVICIESFLKQEPSRLIVEALETSWVFGIPYEKLMSLIEVDKEMANLYRKILEHALYVRLLKTKPEIVLRAPMVHVASFLQMTPETLSRVRASHID